MKLYDKKRKKKEKRYMENIFNAPMVLGWHGREKEGKRMQKHKLGLCKLL